jgi:hypothetical protein
MEILEREHDGSPFRACEGDPLECLEGPSFDDFGRQVRDLGVGRIDRWMR